MDAEAQFFLKRNGRIHGPLLSADVCNLLQARAVDGDTEAARACDGPWGPLRGVPDFAEFIGSLPTHFDRANRDDGPPIDLRELIKAGQSHSPSVRPAPARGEPASAEHDVRALLALNRAVEKRHGFDELAPPPPKSSRRRRDYFRLLGIIGVGIFLVLIVVSFIAVQVQVLAARMPDQLWPMFTQVLFHSPILAWGLASFAFYAIALGWVMFVVMDDY